MPSYPCYTRNQQKRPAAGIIQETSITPESVLDPALRDQWKREKGMQVFSFVDPAEPLALFGVFIEEKIPFQEIMKDLALVTAKGVTIPVVSLRHLKMLKKAAGRPQDLADIEAIEALERPEEEP